MEATTVELTTMVKALIVVKAGLAAAAAALALTACGPAPTGVAGPGLATPNAAAKAAPGAPKALPRAGARRLSQAPASAATLWGLDYRTAYRRSGFARVATPTWAEMRNGRLFWHHSDAFQVEVDYGWTTDKTFSGDGALEDLTGGRFLYLVPPGRVLIVNRVVNPDRVTINGYNLAGLAGDDLSFVFGPGEAVLFAFPTGDANGRSVNCAAKVQGYTADPALLGGSLGAAGGGEPK